MVVMALAPVITQLLLLPVLILGVVLFIVGLVKKKPVMWGIGIAVGVLGLLVLVVGAGMLMFLRLGRVTSVARVQLQASSVTVRTATEARRFYGTTGVTLPDGVSFNLISHLNHETDRPDGQREILVLRMSVPADFDEFLAANFTKAQWSNVAPTFQTGRENGHESFVPNDSQLQAASLYVLTTQPDPNSPATFVTAIAHDANTQEAWTVSVEKPAPAK